MTGGRVGAAPKLSDPVVVDEAGRPEADGHGEERRLVQPLQLR